MEFTYADSLKNKVPKEIRLEVYKRAKNLIENWKKGTFDLYNPELCLLLPCILYNCERYLDRGNCDEYWGCDCTTLAFTEFTEEDIERIMNSKEPTNIRLELVTKWIEQLNQ